MNGLVGWTSRFGSAFLAVIFVTSTAFGQADAERFSDPTSYWNTDRAAVLDSPELLNQLIELQGQANSGEKPDQNAVPGQIVELLLAEMAATRGVHIETALTSLGAMAGFACQMGIREGFVKSGKISLEEAFVVVGTKDGRTFYMGDLINECLVSPRPGNLSVWSLVAGVPQQLGADLPDIVGLIKRSAATLGTEEFGVPDLPKRHMPNEAAQVLLSKYWNVMRNILVMNQVDPPLWPFVLSQAAQQLMVQGKDVLDTGIAANVVVEAAIAMSKADPSTIVRAHFEKAEMP